MTNPDLIELAMRMAQSSAPEAAAPEGSTPKQPDQVQAAPLPAVPPRPFLPRAAEAKGRKTAEELAAMISADLRGMQGCPKVGVKVTVYGSNPWNAWLSFGTDAGPVRNKAELQGFCEIIIDRLKRLYDIFELDSAS